MKVHLLIMLKERYVEGAFYDTDNSFLALNEAFKDLTEVEEQIVVLYVFGGFKQKEMYQILLQVQKMCGK